MKKRTNSKNQEKFPEKKNRDLIEDLGLSPGRENLLFMAGSVVGGNKTKSSKGGNCVVKRRRWGDQPERNRTVMDNSWEWVGPWESFHRCLANLTRNKRLCKRL